MGSWCLAILCPTLSHETKLNQNVVYSLLTELLYIDMLFWKIIIFLCILRQDVGRDLQEVTDVHDSVGVQEAFA